jgi:hypothetical protein
VESLNLLFFFYFGIIYLLLHAIFEININWNVKGKTALSVRWENGCKKWMKRDASCKVQRTKWMICNPMCGEPPASGERVCSMGAWGTKADANYVASVAKSPLHFPQRGKAKRHAAR